MTNQRLRYKESKKDRCSHQTGIKLYIYHSTNLHGGEFRFVNLFNISERQLWQILNLTNQKKMLVEEYFHSNNHLEANYFTDHKTLNAETWKQR